MVAHNNLKEVAHNSIDQILGLAHLVAKVLIFGNPKQMLSYSQIRKILHARLQICAYFDVK